VVELTADNAVRHLAVHGLPGVSTEVIVVESFDDLLDVVHHARVIPFVRDAVDHRRVEGATDAFRSELEQRTRRAAAATLATHAALVDAVGRLRAVGVDPIVLKGCATAHLDHQRPHQRASSDVDVLVPPGSLTDVLAAGIGVPPALRSERWQRRYAKSTAIRDHRGTEIDLHQRLAQGYPGLRIPHDELTANLESFEVGGVELRAFDAPGRLLHAAVHAGASARVGLHSLRDVPQLVLVGDVDWHETVRRAESWRIEGFASAGVLRAWNAFPLPDHPLAAWARSVRSGRRERAARWSHDRLWAGTELSGLVAMAPHHWPGYLGPLVFPSRAYLRSEGVTWTGRVQRTVDRITASWR
jgi:hypothetical protein